MKRPMLISGITIAIVSTFLILFSKTASLIVTAVAVSVFVLYFIKPLKLKQYVVLPLICVCTLLTTLSYTLNNHFLVTPVMEYDGTIQNITGKIITTPETNKGFVTFTIKTLSIGKSTENCKVFISLPEENVEKPMLYDVVSITDSSLYIPKSNNQPDVTNYSDGIVLQGKGGSTSILWKAERTPYYFCLKLKEIVTERIFAYSSDNTSGILKGMIFGGTSSISTNTIKGFRNSGIAHLLAVSGLHTSLWCSLLILILKLFNIPEKVRNSVCIVFLSAFCIISALTPSVMRASFMMMLILVAPFFKRRADTLNSLGLAVATLLLINPYTITSISFQLSATATLGVILASEYERKIHTRTTSIKHNIPRRFIDYICSSLLVSAFAGIFTLPVSAYHFNVFSILSPIANLLCVKPSFYGMISGLIGVVLSSSANSFIRNLAILIFDFSDWILNAVTKISGAIGSVKYCTLPIHKEFLIIAIILVSLIISLGYILSKRTKKTILLKLAAIASVVCIIVNIGIPLLPTKYQNTLTVVSAGNNTNIVLRSGTHYMYIANNEGKVPSHIYNFIPKATSETLDYYIVTYTSYNYLTDIETVGQRVPPQETYVTPSVRYLCQSQGVLLPENTITGYTGAYTLNDKINIEIVDTYRIKYAIIKGSRNNVYIHLHGDGNFSDVVDISDGDVFVYCNKVPADIPEKTKHVIINSNSDILTNPNYNKLKESGVDIKSTATHGDIQIIV